MSSLEKNVEILIGFGLTRSQARVYIAIARLKLAPVGQISKVSKVRREDVYRIIPKLEKMGLVEKILGKPTKIRARPVEEALSVLIEREEETARKRVSALKAQTEIFLKHFARAPKFETEEEPNFVLLSKPESIVGRELSMLKNTDRELDIVGSSSRLKQFMYTFAEDLKRIVNIGGRIRIVSEMPEYEASLLRVIEELISPGNSVDLRYADVPLSHYMIVDFKETLIATTTNGNTKENPCLWTNSTSLVGVFQGDFENLWHNAISWRNIETIAVPEKVVRFMEELRPANHLIFVYDSPEAKYNVLFNYLKVGLHNGEAGVYVATDENPDGIRDAMKRFGIDVEKYEGTGALQILGYEDVYLTDGEFNMITTINFS